MSNLLGSNLGSKIYCGINCWSLLTLSYIAYQTKIPKQYNWSLLWRSIDRCCQRCETGVSHHVDDERKRRWPFRHLVGNYNVSLVLVKVTLSRKDVVELKCSNGYYFFRWGGSIEMSIIEIRWEIESVVCPVEPIISLTPAGNHRLYFWSVLRAIVTNLENHNHIGISVNTHFLPKIP